MKIQLLDEGDMVTDEVEIPDFDRPPQAIVRNGEVFQYAHRLAVDGDPVYGYRLAITHYLSGLEGEITSEEIAVIAARGLGHPASLSMAEIQAVCGSALTQAE